MSRATTLKLVGSRPCSLEKRPYEVAGQTKVGPSRGGLPRSGPEEAEALGTSSDQPRRVYAPCGVSCNSGAKTRRFVRQHGDSGVWNARHARTNRTAHCHVSKFDVRNSAEICAGPAIPVHGDFLRKASTPTVPEHGLPLPDSATCKFRADIRFMKIARLREVGTAHGSQGGLANRQVLQLRL